MKFWAIVTYDFIIIVILTIINNTFILREIKFPWGEIGIVLLTSLIVGIIPSQNKSKDKDNKDKKN